MTHPVLNLYFGGDGPAEHYAIDIRNLVYRVVADCWQRRGCLTHPVLNLCFAGDGPAEHCANGHFLRCPFGRRPCHIRALQETLAMLLFGAVVDSVNAVLDSVLS